MACQLPSTSFRFSTMMVRDEPTSDALMWAWELPSGCRYLPFTGTSRSRVPRRSCFTSGSVPTWRVTAAVVWGQKTVQIPRETPLSFTFAATSLVTSTIKADSSVLILTVWMVGKKPALEGSRSIGLVRGGGEGRLRSSGEARLVKRQVT